MTSKSTDAKPAVASADPIPIEPGATSQDVRLWEEYVRTLKIMSDIREVAKESIAPPKMSPKQFVESLNEQQREALVELLRQFNAVSEGRKP